MKVTPAPDRNCYYVSSQTKRGVKWIVDLEEKTCTCPRGMDYKQAGDTCPHLEAALRFAFPIKVPARPLSASMCAILGIE